jgi:hypothetical protein
MRKISELFLLFTGVNGRETWGCTMEPSLSQDDQDRLGQHQFNLNTYTLNAQSDDELKGLGFADAEILDIRKREEV